MRMRNEDEGKNVCFDSKVNMYDLVCSFAYLVINPQHMTRKKEFFDSIFMYFRKSRAAGA
jgi:hypothetical protein